MLAAAHPHVIQAKSAERAMAKRPPSGKCVHCLCFSDELTWDHVFPKAWYPDTTPLNLAKWKIPSCRCCNAEYGRLEEELLVELAMGLDPDEGPSRGVVQRALRSIDPAFGRDERDVQHRAKCRAELFRKIIVADAIPTDSLLPGFINRHAFPSDLQLGISVHVQKLSRLCEKIVRGLTYIVNGRLVEPPYRVQVGFLKGEAISEFEAAIGRYTVEHSRGPGIMIRRAVPYDDHSMAIFGITIWGRLHFSAFIAEPE